MAIDTATERRAAAGVGMIVSPGVTPDATPGAAWRASAANGYYPEGATYVVLFPPNIVTAAARTWRADAN